MHHCVSCSFTPAITTATEAELYAAPIPNGESATYCKLHAELCRRGVSEFRLARITGPYYDKPLPFRAQRVGADSIHHLCKTMVMENTRLPAELQSSGDPRVSKYYMVLVQYSAAIDTQKLGKWVHKVRLQCVRVCLACPLTG